MSESPYAGRSIARGLERAGEDVDDVVAHHVELVERGARIQSSPVRGS